MKLFNWFRPKQDILELLARAYKYDDKPHRLYSFIGNLAVQYERDPERRAEIIRLMNAEYSRERSE